VLSENGTAPISAIVISLPFSDHCHLDTLDNFPKTIPIIAANGSYKRLKSYYGTSRIIFDLPSSDCDYSTAVRIPGSSFDIVTVQSKLGSLDLTHRGIIITQSKNATNTGSVSTTGITTSSTKHNESSTDESMKRQDTFQDSARLHDNVDNGKQVKATETAEISGLLCYAPHGLRLSSTQKSRISSLAPKGICLLSTVTLYDLPLILGGTVNLGMQNAIELIRDLNAIDFIPTHSSKDRRESGLVTKFATVEMVDIESDDISSFIGKGIMRVAKKPMPL